MGNLRESKVKEVELGSAVVFQKRYFESGNSARACCPICAGSNLTGSSFDTADDIVYQELHCVECGADFTQVFKMVTVEIESVGSVSLSILDKARRDQTYEDYTLRLHDICTSVYFRGVGGNALVLAVPTHEGMTFGQVLEELKRESWELSDVPLEWYQFEFDGLTEKVVEGLFASTFSYRSLDEVAIPHTSEEPIDEEQETAYAYFSITPVRP